MYEIFRLDFLTVILIRFDGDKKFSRLAVKYKGFFINYVTNGQVRVIFQKFLFFLRKEREISLFLKSGGKNLVFS